MSPALARWRALAQNYLFRRVRGRPAPLTFWSLPEPPRVVDAASHAAYLAERPSPRYLMDYRARLRYTETDARGILVLHYPDPVGTQVNPEAAFQQALGAHDAWRDGAGTAARDRFDRTAAWALADQDDRGHWPYRFAWHRSAAPWASALAQMRGASVMLRAFLLTGDPRYGDAARRAADPLERPLDDGGMLGRHPASGAAYFEEYPSEPTAVLNGFLASLFGLYELSTWLDDSRAAALLTLGLDGVEQVLPAYVHRGWSLYDLDSRSPFPNPDSPRYHRLVADYLLVLATISGRPSLADWHTRWQAMDTGPRRLAAIGGKLLRKLRYK